MEDITREHFALPSLGPKLDLIHEDLIYGGQSYDCPAILASRAEACRICFSNIGFKRRGLQELL